ncbi:sensor histidine kinase [Cryptosporangium sp. NPDC048952]|uniref:sensor histidine kinase n=1 Tax=Cryptosporangium sp. NPDC048952 TaxID=3363961 RepID=UPI0037231455
MRRRRGWAGRLTAGGGAGRTDVGAGGEMDERKQLAPGTVAQDALETSAARIALIFRVAWSALTPVLAYPQAMASGGVDTWQHVAIGSTVAWGGAYAWFLRHGRLVPGVAVADSALFCVYLGCAAWVLPVEYVGNPSTWIIGGASVAIFIASWSLTPVGTVVLAAAQSVAFLVGVAASGRPLVGGDYSVVAIFVLQGVLAVAVMRLIRNGARRADATLDHVARARAELTVERSRLRGRRQFERNLHDTVLSTLTVIARGALRTRLDLVRARCGRDVALLDRLDDLPRSTGLFASMAWEAGCRAMPVRLDLPADEPALPTDVSEAIAGAVRESLSNTERHARAGCAEVSAVVTDGGVRIVVRDDGVGFDPGATGRESTGVRRSVVERMAAVGGRADVVSAPGAGTEVTLSWQGAERPVVQPEPDEPAVAAGYHAGMGWALVVIALVWHLYSSSSLITQRDAYRPFWLELTAWLAILVVVLGVAVRGPTKALPLPVNLAAQVLVFAAAVAGFAAIDGTDQIAVNWITGDVGWPLALLALHRPVAEYLAWSAGVVALSVGAVLVEIGPDVGAMTRIVTALLCAMILQLAAVVAFGLVRRSGALAEAGVREAAGIRESRDALTAVAEDRRHWQRELGATLRPLVGALAKGTLDPADPDVRAQCAIEASRLRAMLSELTETGEHSMWRRDMVSSLSGAAADRSATIEARIAPDFGEVPEPVRAELVAAVLAILRMTSPGEAVVTLSGCVRDASATVLLPVASERSAVKEAMWTLLHRVRAAIPGTVSADVEEPGSSKFWVEVRWVS